MDRRRCCCEEPECWYFGDSFTDSDTTDLGSDWNEAVGQWGIESNELVEKYGDSSGTGNAMLFCTQAVPTRSKGEMFIEIEVPIASLADGDKYYIYPCCPTTSTIGDVTCEYEWDATAGEWTTTITGGVGSPSATYTVALTGSPTHVVLKACADHENELVKAWVSPTVNEYAAWESVDPGDGRYSAIGHNNTTHKNRFDDFFIEELRTALEICRNCFCVCDEFAMPPRLTATIVDAEDRASCLGGESWPMDAILGPQVVQWEGGLEKDGEELNYRLTCGDGAPASFNLVPLAPLGCHNSAVQKSADAALSTCEPLALYFGPYTLDFAQDCSLCYDKNQPGCTGMPPIPTECFGEYWIVITL